MANEATWVKYAADRLEGRTIKAVRYLSKEECEQMGWYQRPLVIQLDNGAIIFPSSDDEGNDGGSLFGQGATTAAERAKGKESEDWTFPVLQT